MVMEVLLMADVPDVGSEGDVVKVSDGYARNYLFPRKKAAPVTAATRRQLEKMRRDREEKRKLALAEAQALAAKLESASCTIAVKVAEDEKLYGSVTAAMIAEALKSQGFTVDRQTVALETPIKELGVFKVPVKLHPDVEATVKVWVVEE